MVNLRGMLFVWDSGLVGYYRIVDHEVFLRKRTKDKGYCVLTNLADSGRITMSYVTPYTKAGIVFSIIEAL